MKLALGVSTAVQVARHFAHLKSLALNLQDEELDGVKDTLARKQEWSALRLLNDAIEENGREVGRVGGEVTGSVGAGGGGRFGYLNPQPHLWGGDQKD